MKKTLLILITYSLSLLSLSQSNLNFENWNGNEPVGWTSSNSLTTGSNGSQTVSQNTANPPQGNSSLKLVTGSCPDCPSFIQDNFWIDCTLPNPYGGEIALAPDPFSPGIPYTKRPLSVDILYKSNPQNGDAAGFHLELTKSNPNNPDEPIKIGEAYFEVSNVVTNWTLQNIPVIYYSSDIPDTLNIVATSSIGTVMDCSNSILLPGLPSPYNDLNLPYPQTGSEFELDNIIINLPSCNSLQLTVTGNNETSIGMNDGSASANVSGGSSPYQYLWSNGQTSQTITSLIPATYSVVITDANGCQKTKNIIISPAGCNFTYTISGTNSNSSSVHTGTGSITLNIIGNSTYEVLWNNGAIQTGVTSTSTISNLPVGIYGATIVDENDEFCAKIASQLILGPGGSSVVSNINEKNKIEDDIILYPNPTNGEFNLFGNHISDIYVHTLSGKLIHSQSINTKTPKVKLPHDLSRGIYFIKIKKTTGALLTKKIIIN